jgi:hypothetical protein
LRQPERDLARAGTDSETESTGIGLTLEDECLPGCLRKHGQLRIAAFGGIGTAYRKQRSRYQQSVHRYIHVAKTSANFLLSSAQTRI